MEQNAYSRRKFIHYCAGRSAALLGAMFLLNSCGNNNNGIPAADKEVTDKPDTHKTAADPCNDFSGVNAEELEKRKKFGYIDKSTIADNSCSNCGLYLPGAQISKCGKCLLFKGPVQADGHCIQYVAKATQG